MPTHPRTSTELAETNQKKDDKNASAIDLIQRDIGARNEGCYPTGEAPTPLVDPVLFMFGRFRTKLVVPDGQLSAR